MRLFRGLIAVLVAVAAVSTAHADVIFDNGDSILFGGLLSSGGVLAADNFTLNEGESTITDIHWSGYYLLNTVPSDDFTVYIFEDNGGEPGAAPIHTIAGTATRTDNGSNNLFVSNEYDYVMDIAPIDLLANTTYWIVIESSVPLNEDMWFWSLSNLQTGDANAKLAGVWLDADVELAFQLTNDGVVPEPATMTLLGLGVVALAVRKRFSRSK